MTTFADLVNEVYLTLEGWGLNVGRAAFITGSTLTSGGLSFTVDSTASIGPGLIEIEDELLYVQSVDDSTKTVTISPDGRGYRGTTAASHAVGVRVTMNPVVPKFLVKRAINQTITGVYPTLFGKASVDIASSGAAQAYELPAAVESVIEANFQAPGPSGVWPKVDRFDVDLNADLTDFPSGKAIILIGAFEPGRTVKVTYRKVPTELSADADLLTASGLADTAHAVVVAGALWRLSSTVALARLRTDTTATDLVDQQNGIQQANQAAALLRAGYDQELREEARRQTEATPPSISWKD